MNSTSSTSAINRGAKRAASTLVAARRNAVDEGTGPRSPPVAMQQRKTWRQALELLPLQVTAVLQKYKSECTTYPVPVASSVPSTSQRFSFTPSAPASTIPSATSYRLLPSQEAEVKITTLMESGMETCAQAQQWQAIFDVYHFALSAGFDPSEKMNRIAGEAAMQAASDRESRYVSGTGEHEDGSPYNSFEISQTTKFANRILLQQLAFGQEEPQMPIRSKKRQQARHWKQSIPASSPTSSTSSTALITAQTVLKELRKEELEDKAIACLQSRKNALHILSQFNISKSLLSYEKKGDHKTNATGEVGAGSKDRKFGNHNLPFEIVSELCDAAVISRKSHFELGKEIDDTEAAELVERNKGNFLRPSVDVVLYSNLLEKFPQLQQSSSSPFHGNVNTFDLLQEAQALSPPRKLERIVEHCSCSSPSSKKKDQENNTKNILVADASFVENCFASLVMQSDGALIILLWSTVCELEKRSRFDPHVKTYLEELLAASNVCGRQKHNNKNSRGGGARHGNDPPLCGVEIFGLRDELYLQKRAFDELQVPLDDSGGRVAATAKLFSDLLESRRGNSGAEDSTTAEVKVLSKNKHVLKMSFQFGL